MSVSRQQIVCAIVALIGAGLYFGNKPSETDHRANSISEAPNEARGVDPHPNTFAGYECTEDCSGHEAGYAWAEEHGISDGDECDAAGQHSNSPPLQKDATHMSMGKPAIPRRAEIPTTTTDLRPNSHYLFLLSRMSPRFLFDTLKYPAFSEARLLRGHIARRRWRLLWRTLKWREALSPSEYFAPRAVIFTGIGFLGSISTTSRPAYEQDAPPKEIRWRIGQYVRRWAAWVAAGLAPRSVALWTRRKLGSRCHPFLT
jgi:hypothetical protein